MGRFSVKIGKSFEIDEVEIDEAEEVALIAEAAVSVADASARGFILKAMVTAELVFLFGAGAYSLIKGDFTYLASIWMATAPIAGGTAAYYFRLNKEVG